MSNAKGGAADCSERRMVPVARLPRSDGRNEFVSAVFTLHSQEDWPTLSM